MKALRRSLRRSSISPAVLRTNERARLAFMTSLAFMLADVGSHRLSGSVVRIKCNYMSRGLSYLEGFVFRRNSFDWRGSQPELGKAPVVFLKIFHHQIERRVAGCNLRFGYQHQMRAAAKFQHCDFLSLNDRAHS